MWIVSHVHVDHFCVKLDTACCSIVILWRQLPSFKGPLTHFAICPAWGTTQPTSACMHCTIWHRSPLWASLVEAGLASLFCAWWMSTMSKTILFAGLVVLATLNTKLLMYIITAITLTNRFTVNYAASKTQLTSSEITSSIMQGKGLVMLGRPPCANVWFST